jgi:Arc/MetJ-type ribon-helix-helix transcriptional regulator
MANLTLTAEQQRSAASIAATGQYRDVADVITTALATLQRFETERATLLASLLEARAEGEREGFATAEDVAAEMGELIREASRPQA